MKLAPKIQELIYDKQARKNLDKPTYDNGYLDGLEAAKVVAEEHDVYEGHIKSLLIQDRDIALNEVDCLNEEVSILMQEVTDLLWKLNCDGVL